MGETIAFDAASQNGYTFSCTPYTWTWNFGDGEASAAERPSHQYGATGTYRVSVTLIDALGQSATVMTLVNVSSLQPNPSGCPPLSPQSAYVGYYGGVTGCTPENGLCMSGETIAFTLYPQNGYSFICSPYSYLWNFGDNQTSTSEQPTHQYAAAGTYNISVSVIDNAGQSTTISQSVRISDRPRRHRPSRH